LFAITNLYRNAADFNTQRTMPLKQMPLVKTGGNLITKPGGAACIGWLPQKIN
jgi:hypothetical protein